MDVFALGYLALVVLLASQTYRWVEVPCRDFFGRLASRQAPRNAVAAAE